MKKKHFTLIAAVLALLLVFSACGSAAPAESPKEAAPEKEAVKEAVKEAAPAKEAAEPEPTPEPFRPLSLQEQNRLYNASHYLITPELIYSNFFDSQKEFHFGCVKPGGGMEDYTWLSREPVSFSHIVDGVLYVLTCQDPNGGFFRFNEELNSRERIYSMPNRSAHKGAQYYEGWFYFTDNNKDYRYFRLSPETGEAELVLDKEIYYPLIHDGWLLYQDDADSERLHWYNLESREDYCVSPSAAYCPYLDGEYIYYFGGEENPGFHRIKADGTEDCLISDYSSYGGIAVDENYIYFVPDEAPYYLFRMNKDGTAAAPLGTVPYNQNPYLSPQGIYAEQLIEDLSFYYDYKYLDPETGEYIKSLGR